MRGAEDDPRGERVRCEHLGRALTFDCDDGGCVHHGAATVERVADCVGIGGVTHDVFYALDAERFEDGVEHLRPAYEQPHVVPGVDQRGERCAPR